MKHTALYCRLSQDDGSAGESMSISSQKMILENHAKSIGLFNYKFYVDDGYSGTNFNRPAFQKMITDIKMTKLIVFSQRIYQDSVGTILKVELI